MSRLNRNQIPDTEGEDPTWKSLYKIGGVAALVVVLVMLMEILLALLPGGGAMGPGTSTILDWLALFQDNWFMGLRNLGLVNMIAASFSIPVFLALYAAHRRVDKGYAALALILFLVGTTVYLANNTAFPMLALSGKYAAAGTDVHRSQLAAAGEAMLAQAESHTPGTFVGFLYTEVSSLVIAFVMLRNRIFSKPAAYAGFVGFGLLLVFEILSSFVPALFAVAMIIVMVGGLASITWYALISRELFQLGRL